MPHACLPGCNVVILKRAHQFIIIIIVFDWQNIKREIFKAWTKFADGFVIIIIKCTSYCVDTCARGEWYKNYIQVFGLELSYKTIISWIFIEKIGRRLLTNKLYKLKNFQREEISQRIFDQNQKALKTLFLA